VLVKRSKGNERKPGPADVARASDPTSAAIGRSLLRLMGLVLAIVPLFAGFLPVLFTDRRRGLPDFLAGTVVVYG
jgi:uncharacterized RDD family membrane protein YckC